MFGAIVLRNVPKEAAGIDLMQMPIQGGFRGFDRTPPACWHYASVQSRGVHVGFWCRLPPRGVVVRVFDAESHSFGEDDPETEAQFVRLAQSGAMGRALRPYPHQQFGDWFGLVRHMNGQKTLPVLHEADVGERPSRFGKAFYGTHQGSADAFLAEFQYAFLRWLFSLKTVQQDEAALARWRHLLLSAYNAGEDNIRSAADLFANLPGILTRQFALLPDEHLAPGGWLTMQIDYMIEDMEDTGDPNLGEQAARLRAYLARRRR